MSVGLMSKKTPAINKFSLLTFLAGLLGLLSVIGFIVYQVRFTSPKHYEFIVPINVVNVVTDEVPCVVQCKRYNDTLWIYLKPIK